MLCSRYYAIFFKRFLVTSKLRTILQLAKVTAPLCIVSTLAASLNNLPYHKNGPEKVMRRTLYWVWETK
jgi:hypothetical protein